MKNRVVLVVRKRRWTSQKTVRAEPQMFHWSTKVLLRNLDQASLRILLNYLFFFILFEILLFLLTEISSRKVTEANLNDVAEASGLHDFRSQIQNKQLPPRNKLSPNKITLGFLGKINGIEGLMQIVHCIFML